MNRRQFLGSGGTIVLLAGRRAALAQEVKLPLIGYLAHGSGPTSLDEAFLRGLRDAGYVEGVSARIDLRFAKGDARHLRSDAFDLVARGAEVIVAAGPLATRAAMEATSRIPIVMMVADPIGSGFVNNISRPNGNVTGRSFLGTELNVKRLEVLKEALPGLSKLAVLFNGGNPGSVSQLRNVQEAAAGQGVTILPVDVGPGGSIEKAFASAARVGADALLVLSQGQNVSPDQDLRSAAIKYRLPTMFATASYVAAGGLMSYGANLAEVYRQTAAHVDRILKGALPGELPVEAPTAFELSINLGTAKALGLTLSPSLLALADEVIE